MKKRIKSTTICKQCKEKRVGRNGFHPDGKVRYSSMCHRCRNTKWYFRYRKPKKDTCAVCEFMGHYCQMDIDHIDGNHFNNEPTNLQTLCANCHRMKTFNQRWVG